MNESIKHATAMEFDCAAWFLSTLQHLLLVPSYDLMGKQMWERIEHAVSFYSSSHLDPHFYCRNLLDFFESFPPQHYYAYIINYEWGD